MHVLLTGASGFIGNAVLRELLRQGHCVSACSREPERLPPSSPAVKAYVIDFAGMTAVEQWLPYLDGVDAIVNCVGIIAETETQTFARIHTQAPQALFRAGAQAGVRRIVQISALGADADAVTAFHLSKYAADQALRELALDWFVLQPSLVYGEGGRSAALMQALAALPLHVLADGGGQPLQPIPVGDVAAAAARCLDPAQTGRKTVALVGPRPIAYADYLQGLRRRLGKPPAARCSLPYRYAAWLAGLGKFLDEPILSADALAMLGRGNSADPAAAAALLGRQPRGVEEMLFQQPASQAERLQAALYFFQPLLGLAIALVWLWSGITSLFFYPHALSYRLLADAGVSGIAAPLALHGLAGMDIAMGMATLSRYRIETLLVWQIGAVLAYSLFIAWRLPEFWLHPFGPLLKNIPFLFCLLIYRQMLGVKP